MTYEVWRPAAITGCGTQWVLVATFSAGGYDEATEIFRSRDTWGLGIAGVKGREVKLTQGTGFDRAVLTERTLP